MTGPCARGAAAPRPGARRRARRGPGERLLRHAGIGSGREHRARLPARPGARGGAREPARPRGSARSRGTPTSSSTPTRLVSISAPAPGTVVDRGRCGGASARSRPSSACRCGARLPRSASRRRGSRERTVIAAPRRPARGAVPRRARPCCRSPTLAALVTTKPVAGASACRARRRRPPRRSSCRRLGRFERQPVDARFVVDGTRVRDRSRRPGPEARRRADRRSPSSRTSRRGPIGPGSSSPSRS